MNRLAELRLEERTVYFAQAAARLALPPAAVEKDFWVCWTLARLFSSERLAPRILFKERFYFRAGSRYDLAKPGTFRLLPPAHGRKSLAEDYEKMQVMLFGEAPAFDEILDKLGRLEQAINRMSP